jgi:hypothetical protein
MDEDAFTFRNDILEKVGYGLLSPDEAEEEARQHGLEPFTRKPSPAEFNPFALEHWTLPMTIAWIAWRTPAMVCEQWDAFLENRLSWQWRRWRHGADGTVHAGYFLEQERPASVATLRIAAVSQEMGDPGAEPRIAVEDAIDLLWRLLGRGAIRATAVDSRGHERTAIPYDAWPRLKLSETDDRDDLRDMSRYPFGVHYVDVLLSVADVRKVWTIVWDLSVPVPHLVEPSGDGYLPLFCAAHWIASQGGAVEPGWTADTWQAAYRHLLCRVQVGTIEVIGERENDIEVIKPYQFASCRIAYPFEDHWNVRHRVQDRAVLISCPFIDDERWREGWDDSLVGPDGPLWRRIMVRRDQVAAAWPFKMKRTTYKTGLPGKPTSKHLIIAEFQARVERRETCATVSSPPRIQAPRRRRLAPSRTTFAMPFGRCPAPRNENYRGRFIVVLIALSFPAAPALSVGAPEESTNA